MTALGFVYYHCKKIAQGIGAFEIQEWRTRQLNQNNMFLDALPNIFFRTCKGCEKE